MATMNVSVPDAMRDWVEQRIEGGHYASASGYVRDLIRRDQARSDEHAALIAALVEGEAGGVSPRRIPDILDAIRQERRGRTDD